jgi:hypothetical protein
VGQPAATLPLVDAETLETELHALGSSRTSMPTERVSR